MPGHWRRGVYVHRWGADDFGHALPDPRRVWWAVVLRSWEWRLDGVWLPVAGRPSPDPARQEFVCLYRNVRFAPDRLELPAHLPGVREEDLLARAEHEWLAAALGGYLPADGTRRTVRTSP